MIRRRFVVKVMQRPPNGKMPFVQIDWPNEVVNIISDQKLHSIFVKNVSFSLPARVSVCVIAAETFLQKGHDLKHFIRRQKSRTHAHTQNFPLNETIF